MPTPHTPPSAAPSQSRTQPSTDTPSHPTTPHNRRPMRSLLSATRPAAPHQDFAPRRARKKPRTPTETSPSPSPSPRFTPADATRLDTADRALHDALRAHHRTDQRTPVPPTAQDPGPRRTGAALLEYRRNQKTEILARQAARRSLAVVVVLDTTLADRTAAMLERHAGRRRGRDQPAASAG